MKYLWRHQRRQNVDFELLLRIQIRKWESLVFTPENISLEVRFISLLTRVLEVAAFEQLQNANFENVWRLNFASKLRTLTWVFWSSTSNAPGYKSHLEIESFFVKQKLSFWELSLCKNLLIFYDPWLDHGLLYFESLRLTGLIKNLLKLYFRGSQKKLLTGKGAGFDSQGGVTLFNKYCFPNLHRIRGNAIQVEDYEFRHILHPIKWILRAMLGD